MKKLSKIEKTKIALMNSTLEIEQTTFLRALIKGCWQKIIQECI